MRETIKILEPRRIDEINLEYMNASLEFLDHFQFIEFLEMLGMKKIDLTRITLNDFVEWLHLTGEPEGELVSLASALTYMGPHWGWKNLSIKQIYKYFEENSKSDTTPYVEGVLEIHRSLELLHDIVNR